MAARTAACCRRSTRCRSASAQGRPRAVAGAWLRTRGTAPLRVARLPCHVADTALEARGMSDERGMVVYGGAAGTCGPHLC